MSRLLHSQIGRGLQFSLELFASSSSERNTLHQYEKEACVRYGVNRLSCVASPTVNDWIDSPQHSRLDDNALYLARVLQLCAVAYSSRINDECKPVPTTYHRESNELIMTSETGHYSLKLGWGSQFLLQLDKKVAQLQFSLCLGRSSWPPPIILKFGRLALPELSHFPHTQHSLNRCISLGSYTLLPHGNPIWWNLCLKI